MLMTPEEIQNSVKWAANAKAPIDRDVQIVLMRNAKERHLATMNRALTLIKNLDKE